MLSAHSLSMTFPSENGGLHAVDGVSFDVAPQEFVCLLGPSGCGKTTILRLLAGLLVPTGGQVVFNGEVVRSPPHGVGIVFQDSNLMPWRTVRENIRLPLDIERRRSRDAVEELIDLVGLNGFEDALPGELSGGMAQRVAIARALVYDPDVLLLDEPFGALDALTRERMRLELLRIWTMRRKTVVMVTHSINEAVFLADRVLVLSPRPAQLRLDLAVDLPRPRAPEVVYTERFGELARRVRTAIEGNTDSTDQPDLH
jgi:NitT/TauT family transport system ATP-binding protein